jgi:hypothetical protein
VAGVFCVRYVLVDMDFSRLDFSANGESLDVCVPREWRITPKKQDEEGNKVTAATMKDLLDESVPAPKSHVDPKSAFEIPKVKIVTPEMKLELAAIRLRRYAHKDKFMKSSDSKDIPSRFQIGTMVGGGAIAAGAGSESQAAGTSNRRKRSGKSHLSNLLHDDTVKDWLHKNIEKRHNVARPKSKHPKIRKNRI